MALKLEDKWVWDLWLSPEKVDGLWHMFFLQAPKSLVDPELRHGNATVGHATSTDLFNWEYHGTAIGPGPHGSWDDRAIWTGSLVKSHSGVWHMFFTGTNKSHEEGLIQRIGVATSHDLFSWEKNPDYLVEADERWYESITQIRNESSATGHSWYEEAWRDPWVFENQEGTEWVMLITARSRIGRIDERGTIGVARSSNLRDWKVCPPLNVHSEFGHFEVPQLLYSASNKRAVTFCLAANNHGEVRRLHGKPIWTGNGIMRSDSLNGSWIVDDEPFLGEPFYAARIVKESGRLLALSWINYIGDTFHGYIEDPIDVTEKLMGFDTSPFSNSEVEIS